MIMSNLISKFIVFNTFNVYADEYVAQNFCQDFSKTLQLLSVFLLIIRLCVPIFIIIVGSIDIYKTVTSGKLDDLKKNLLILGKRLIIGLIVFFIPTILRLVINSFGEDNADYQICINCIDNPSNCK